MRELVGKHGVGKDGVGEPGIIPRELLPEKPLMQNQLPVFVFKEMIEWELRRLFSEDIFRPMSFRK